jgi:hypothetical protein
VLDAPPGEMPGRGTRDTTPSGTEIVKRVVALGLALAALLAALGWVVRVYQRRSYRMRSQPLVTLIDRAARRLPGTPAPFPRPLPTSKTLEAADAAVVGSVLALLDGGVPPDGWGETEVVYEGQNEFTPLMVAAIRRLPKTTALLIRRGAKVNEIDHDGRTALMWAAKSGNSRVVRVLLAAGADPNIVDRRGRTALDYATFLAGGWDRKEAVMRPLKRVHAEPGPYEKRHQSPYDRFTLKRTRTGRFSQEASGDGITFLSATHMEFPSDGAPVVTREKRDRLRRGMTYPEVASVIGEDEVGGEMMPDYQGTFSFTQGHRRIELRFQQGRVADISSTGL